MTNPGSMRHVAFSSDARGVKFLKVAMYTLLKNAAPDRPMTVHVIHGGAEFDEAVRADVRTVAEKFPFAAVAFHDADACFDRHPGAFEHLMHFGRMFIGECIPEDVNVVYLDTDVMVLRDLEELFSLDMGDNVFAAVSEAQCVDGVCDPADCDLFPPDAEFYFNSGVMVFNLKAYREGDYLNRAIAWHRENHQFSKLHDQDVLNGISVGRTLRLPMKFNFGDGWIVRFMKCGVGRHTWRGNEPLEVWEAIKNPAVVHFVGHKKPWRACHRPLRRIYHRYMLELGWEPPQEPLGNIFYDVSDFLLRRIAVPLRAVYYRLREKMRTAWHPFYDFMLAHPGFGRKATWRFLKASRILDLFEDEGYLKLQLTGITGERYASAEDGGGINSLIVAQMLYWKSDLPSRCSDKVAVREFVRSRGLGDILVPFVPSEESWTRAEDIPWDRLPDQFVLKCNNGSAHCRLIRDKSAIDREAMQLKANEWLKSKFGLRQREWQYAKIKSRLFAEELLPGEEGPAPFDYKITCSNGRPLFVWVDTGRGVHHESTIFDLDFNRLDVTIGVHPGARDLKRPKNWERMLEIASILSKGIPIVRVDLYNIDGRIYFGELTFTSGRARLITKPFEFSNRMARLADPICKPVC